MRYRELESLSPAAFKRLTGVSKETFSDMLVALEAQIRSFGRPSKLSLADQLLLTLTYWREYRTQFHIAQSYGVSEATVCRAIVKIENTLARSGQFRLPGKKALRGEGCSIEVVLVDATEQPIERPKKRQAAQPLQRQEEAPHAEGASWQSTPLQSEYWLQLLEEARYMTLLFTSTTSSRCRRS